MIYFNSMVTILYCCIQIIFWALLEWVLIFCMLGFLGILRGYTYDGRSWAIRRLKVTIAYDIGGIGWRCECQRHYTIIHSGWLLLSDKNYHQIQNYVITIVYMYIFAYVCTCMYDDQVMYVRFRRTAIIVHMHKSNMESETFGFKRGNKIFDQISLTLFRS